MSEELQDFDEELERLCAEIKKGIDALPKMKPQDRQSKVTYLEGRINRAKQVFRSFKVELRDLSKAEGAAYHKKAKEYNETINKLIQDLNWLQDREDLFDGTQRPQDVEQMTADQIIEKGAQIQQDSITSLGRTLQTIENTKEVGTATAARLKEQTEQLRKVGEDIEEVQANLKVAGKQLRAFVRRMATDKIIMCFIVLILIAVVVVIVLRIVKGGSGGGIDSF
mmetsp:Transcript_12212/g.16874  ORF Transcript_12212/g.16874 Transcript_12212/m.16874 type:complete len:224 (-) Transcript_12212:675-1346(-)